MTVIYKRSFSAQLEFLRLASRYGQKLYSIHCIYGQQVLASFRPCYIPYNLMSSCFTKLILAYILSLSWQMNVSQWPYEPAWQARVASTGPSCPASLNSCRLTPVWVRHPQGHPFELGDTCRCTTPCKCGGAELFCPQKVSTGLQAQHISLRAV